MAAAHRAPTLADHFWRLSSQPANSDNDPAGLVERFLSALEGGGSVDLNAPPEEQNLVAWLRSQELAGDLTYASPEQARGEPLDQRSLVFSVGVLLFEQLTGRHPFGVEHNKRIARLRNAKLASGVNYFPKIPAELRAVVVKAIAAFPEERWNNLIDLKRQLQACVQLLRMPEARRALRVRSLPAIPERHATPAHRMSPLEGDEALDLRFEPVVTREASRLNVRLATAATRLKKSSAPLAWMAIGAVGAVAVTAVLVLGGESPDDGRAEVASSEARAEVPAAQARAEVPAAQARAEVPAAQARAEVPAAQAETATTAPAPSADTARVAATNVKAPPTAAPTATASPAAGAPATVASAQPAATALTFSVEASEAIVAATAYSCFDKHRLARAPLFIGATLRYEAKSGLSSRAYLGGTAGTSPAERSCLAAKLRGLSAGGPPAKATLVHYDLSLSADKAKARGRLE